MNQYDWHLSTAVGSHFAGGGLGAVGAVHVGLEWLLSGRRVCEDGIGTRGLLDLFVAFDAIGMERARRVIWLVSLLELGPDQR